MLMMCDYLYRTVSLFAASSMRYEAPQSGQTVYEISAVSGRRF